MSQPQFSVRALDANGEPLWGNGQGNFLYDLDAVAQTIMTRLKSFQGEWWADLTDGLPLFQSILGSNNGKKTNVISLLIQENILGFQPAGLVTGVFNVSSTYNASARAYSFSCGVNTIFGALQVTFTPGNMAVLPT